MNEPTLRQRLDALDREQGRAARSGLVAVRYLLLMSGRSESDVIGLVVMCDGRRREHRLTDGVCAEHFVDGPRLDHERVAVFTGHQYLSLKRDWRGGKGCRYRYATALILHFPGASIEAG